MGEVSRALEAALRALGAPGGEMVALARQIALALDSEPSQDNLVQLSREFRQVMGVIRSTSRPQTTELDTILDRLRATEFDV